MSDEGERTCPLCAEEMDLTDQQLRPCKCGYQICVWCWHHIMDMAEKDNTEGRCPACRSPYDKEKIVGMAANCERLVAEVHMERKMKSQKAKSKSSEGRKQLNDVRVIRRNLVYIVGLPLDLADEDLLQQREYFGQYGKVLKVSMSRTAAGVVQQFPNSTCSVYITYSKEEEAVRCIQNVHGFVLEGRPLRACFGTTKYCHAWLRNMPCNNPDCVYLHEIGSQEDSFTKDEIVSAYTRSHVQHITGAATNMERRSGNVLPHPLDDCTSNNSEKPIAKNTSSNSVSTVRGSPPNGSPAKPMAPPAAWGLRATNCQPAAGGLSCPTGLSKPKPDSISSTLPFSSAVASTNQVSKHNESIKRQVSSDGRHSIVPGEKNNTMNVLASASEKTLASDVSLAPVNSNTQLSSIPLARDGCTTSNTTKSMDITSNSNGSFCPEEVVAATNEEIQNLSYGLSSLDLDRNVLNEHYNVTKPSSPPTDYVLVKSMQSQGSEHIDKFRNVVNTTNAASKASISDSEVCKSKEYDLKLDSQSKLASGYVEVEDDATSFDSQRLKDPEVVSHSYLPRSCFPYVTNHNNPHPLQHGEPCTVVNTGSLATDNEVGYESQLHGSKALCDGYSEKLDSTSSYSLLHDESNDHHIGRLISKTVNIGNDAATTDNGESSIISNILSMEFDAWDDLAKLLSDSTENQNGPLKKSSSWNVQTNQSRFSFARQEESKIQAFDMNPSHGANQQLLRSRSLIQDFVETTDVSLDKVGIAYGFPANNIEESENLSSGQFVASSNKLSANSKPQISAPPGFSVPSRPPPPGFSSHERMGQTFDSISGNSLPDPFLWRNSYQTPSTGNFGGAGDIEFMDPAILAVGKGRLQGALNSPTLDMQSNYTPQLNYLENEARHQLLMQRSLSPQHNHRFSEIGNTFSQLGDPYGVSSRIDQSHVSNLATFPQLSLQQSRNAVLSNGNWDGWNELQNGNRMGMAELLRNESPDIVGIGVLRRKNILLILPFIFGVCCATTVFVPSSHNYRIWSFLGLGMITYTAWYLTIAANVHGQAENVTYSGQKKS